MFRMSAILYILLCTTLLWANIPTETDLILTIQERVNHSIAESAITKGKQVVYDFTVISKNLPSPAEVLAEDKLPALVKSFVIPAETAELTISRITTEVYDPKGEYLYTTESIDPKKIYLSDSFYFKEARGFSVFIDLYTLVGTPFMVSDLGCELHIIKSASFTLQGSGEYPVPTDVSEAFIESYRTLFANFDSSYLVDLQFKKPSMLVVSHTILNQNPTFTAFLNWKRATGIDIHLVYIEDITGGVSTTSVHNLIATKYAQLENKPDFLLLVGGARAGVSYYIPAYTIIAPGSSDAVGTDFNYSLIEGEDYFPEMIIGRFSASANNLLNTIFSRIPAYERAIENTNNWYNRATLVAANYASASLQPVTPIITSRWMAEKLRGIGYSTTEIYYGFPPGDTPSDITNAIDLGSSIVTYRGWGNQNGWALPQFQVSNVATLNNGARMPVVYSIVCGTGDYLHPSINPCFGEQWMTTIVNNQARGAVGFVGPTYLHTSTDYNNSLASGITWGIVHQNIRIYGSTVMRGKIEMYNNFPREREASDNVPFYWRIYNILSDPSLNMWVKEPLTFPTTVPASVSTHDNAIEINAPGIAYGHATATRNNTDYTFIRIVNGHAILPLPNSDTGNVYVVTLTARNYKPIQQIVQISAETGVGMLGYEIGSGAFMAGQTAQVNIAIKNFGSTTADFMPVLTTSSPFVTEMNTPQVNQNIPAGGTSNIGYYISLAENCPDDIDISFNINLNGHNAKFSLVAGGHVFEVTSAVPQNTAEVLAPGETATVTLTIHNPKSTAVSALTATVTALTNAINITQNTFNIANIAADGDATGNITLTVGADCFIGRICPFQIVFTKDGQEIARSPFSMTIGSVDQTTVTGPDNYGYYAYDTSDTRYGDLAPVYSWVEIPSPATSVSLPDDITQTIDLPFTFRFYGTDHNRLSINDNGWASFGETYNIDFRNWSIPSMLGPKDMLAVFWDDLKGLRRPGEGPGGTDLYDDVVVKYWHDVANGRFVITWQNAFFSQDQLQTSGSVTFQIILIPRADADGDIIYQYHTIFNYSQNRNYSTIGIQNSDHTDGICYSFSDYYMDSATPLFNGLAIKFTTTPPDPYQSESDIALPLPAVTLHQNYPNPFNPTTSIAFTLKDPAVVGLHIYNLRGQRVKTLLTERRDAGNHTVIWNGTNDINEPVASGVYFYQLQTSTNQSMIKKMILMK